MSTATATITPTLDVGYRKWTTGNIGIEVEFPWPESALSNMFADHGMNFAATGYNHDVFSRIAIKHDGSCGVDPYGDGAACDGSELVSPILSVYDLALDQGVAGDYGQAIRMTTNLDTEIADISGVDSAGNAEHYDRCGIHVHVGIKDRAAENIGSTTNRRRLDRLWQAYAGRRVEINRFCGVMRDPNISSHARRYCSEQLALSSKYGQINASPVIEGRMNTVEFRQLGVTATRQDWNDTLGMMTFGEPKFHSWGDIVEWALFVDLLTEAAARPGGWIIEARDATYGSFRPYDGNKWSGYWVRPTMELSDFEGRGSNSVRTAGCMPEDPAIVAVEEAARYRSRYGCGDPNCNIC